MKKKFDKETKISKNSKKIINFNGNIIATIQESDEHLNSRIRFPRFDHSMQDGLAFFYCRSGKFNIELTNGKTVLLTKNTIFISKPGIIKNVMKLEVTSMLMIYIKKEFFNMYFDCNFSIEDEKYNVFPLKEYEATAFERVINYNEYPQKLQKIFIVSKTLEGLMHISSHYLEVSYNRNKMEYIRDYIINNIHEKLTIKNLADKISISETNFKIKFKEYFGVTSKEYIRNFRLEMAKDLLLNTSLNIKEIFSKIGIENYQTFYNLFILKYGLSPTKLRVKNHEEKQLK